MFDEEIKEIEEKEFNSLKILKSTKEKIFKYSELLTKISGEIREFAGCLVKPEYQKEDIVTDVYLPFQKSTTSGINLSGYSDYIKLRELSLLGYHMIGEFHYHGTFLAHPSPADEESKERIRVLSSSPMVKSYTKTFLKGNANNLKFGNGERIKFNLDSRFVDSIELKLKDSIFPQFLTDNFRKIVKKLRVKTFEDRLREAEVKINLNLIIHYAYNMILNKDGEIYSEIIYQPICPACGPYPVKFKRVKTVVIEDFRELNEEEMKKDLEEKVIYGSSKLQQKIRELDERERMLLWGKYI